MCHLKKHKFGLLLGSGTYVTKTIYTTAFYGKHSMIMLFPHFPTLGHPILFLFKGSLFQNFTESATIDCWYTEQKKKFKKSTTTTIYFIVRTEKPIKNFSAIDSPLNYVKNKFSIWKFDLFRCHSKNREALENTGLHRI